MAGWTRADGPAVGLPLENVDTDQLIPARFMSAPRAEGYGRFLLHDLRRDEGGAPDPACPLEAAGAEGAAILVARRNFGSGSSREAAVYALVDAGFRAVLAPSFGDIFAANAANNGLVAGRIAPEAAEAMLAALAAGPAQASLDIEAREAAVAGLTARFEIDPAAALKIANGWDDIDLTASRRGEIGRFREARRREAPWAWPSDA